MLDQCRILLAKTNWHVQPQQATHEGSHVTDSMLKWCFKCVHYLEDFFSVQTAVGHFLGKTRDKSHGFTQGAAQAAAAQGYDCVLVQSATAAESHSSTVAESGASINSPTLQS